MNDKFDELTRQLAQSTTRRQALKKFGVGLAGMVLACFGLPNQTSAGVRGGYCAVYGGVYDGRCVDLISCTGRSSRSCHPGRLPGAVVSNPCSDYDPTKSC